MSKNLFYSSVILLSGLTFSITPTLALKIKADTGNQKEVVFNIQSWTSANPASATVHYDINLEPGEARKIDITDLLVHLQKESSKKHQDIGGFTHEVSPNSLEGYATCFSKLITSTTNINDINDKTYIISYTGKQLSCETQ